MTLGVIALITILSRAEPRRAMTSIRVTALAIAAAAVLVWPTYVDVYRERRVDEWQLQIRGFSQSPDAWEWFEQQIAGEPAIVCSRRNQRHVSVLWAGHRTPAGDDLERRRAGAIRLVSPVCRSRGGRRELVARPDCFVTGRLRCPHRGCQFRRVAARASVDECVARGFPAGV